MSTPFTADGRQADQKANENALAEDQDALQLVICLSGWYNCVG